jgi:AbiV family abortive infection protein
LPHCEPSSWENTASLIDDAEVLFVNQRYARAFSLCVIAIEEASKIPYLLECAEKIIGGQPLDWPEVHKFLNSHQQKLMANLMAFKRVQSPSRVPAKGTADWEDAVARVREMDGFKQDGFYVSLGDTGSSAPHGKFDETRTAMVLGLAKVAFNTSDLMGRGFDARQAGATRSTFAPAIRNRGVWHPTLRNWEQSRRTSDGSALALLRVARKNLKAVIEAPHTRPRRRAA